MKTLSIRALTLTVTTVAFLGLAGGGLVSADPSFSIQIGQQGPPPDRQDYQPWQSPDRSAVWIPGHHEWQDGQYVWVGGYYGYPPHHGGRWVKPHYSHHDNGNTYVPGHWSN